jgi:hypothetical protein
MRYVLILFVTVQIFSSCAPKSEIEILMEKFYGKLELPSNVKGLEYSIKTWNQENVERYKHVKIENIDELNGFLYRHSTVESDRIEVKGEKIKYYQNNNEVSGLEGPDSKEIRDHMRSKLQIYQTILFAPNYILENADQFNFISKDSSDVWGELSIYKCRKWPEHLKVSSSNDIKFYFTTEGQLVSIKEFETEEQGVSINMYGNEEYNGKVFPKLSSIFTIDKDGKKITRIEEQKYAFGHNLMAEGTRVFRD